MVDFQSLRLEVRSEGAANFWAFIPVDTQPTETLQDGFNRTRHLASLVSIFDPYDEFATVVTGEKPVEESRSDVADVGRSGGAGRVPDADFSGQVNTPLIALGE
jgi:hypothetical protein